MIFDYISTHQWAYYHLKLEKTRVMSTTIRKVASVR